MKWNWWTKKKDVLPAPFQSWMNANSFKLEGTKPNQFEHHLLYVNLEILQDALVPTKRDKQKPPTAAGRKLVQPKSDNLIYPNDNS